MDYFQLATPILYEATDIVIKQIMSSDLEVNTIQLNIDSILYEEKLKAKKAEIDRIKLKDNIHLTKDLEQKILNKDLEFDFDSENRIQEIKKEKQQKETVEQASNNLKEAKNLVKKINEEKREREKKRMEAERTELDRRGKVIEEREK